MNKKLLITIFIALFLLLATFAAINFAKGYRIDFKKKKVAETGLLVVNSFPTGASVFINDKLTTATNDTLNLPPGDYKVKIIKDGYIAWEKNLSLKKELVTQANARLFPAAPDLKALTFTGASNLVPSPDGEKIAYVIASASSSLKNGLWVLDLTNNALSFSKETKQVATNTSDFDFAKARLTWSSTSKEILAQNGSNNYLLSIDRSNDLTTALDVSARLSLIIAEWEEELALKTKEEFKALPDFMIKTASESAKNIFFSPDQEMVLYTATASATLSEGLIKPLLATSTQPQTRMIEPGSVYVYDIKEDKNFFIANAEANIQWFPTSKHLLLVEDNNIIILEYDGTNRATVYAGFFKDSFVSPWPDGSKLIILTTLTPDSPLPPNLYAIDLK